MVFIKIQGYYYLWMQNFYLVDILMEFNILKFEYAGI